FRHDMQRERGLARRFRPVNLDDAAARQPADAECDVQAERAGGDRLDLDRLLVLAEAHDRALAAIALDLRDRRFKRLLFIHFSSFDEAQRDIHHGGSPLFHKHALSRKWVAPPPPPRECHSALVGLGREVRCEMRSQKAVHVLFSLRNVLFMFLTAWRKPTGLPPDSRFAKSGGVARAKMRPGPGCTRAV